MTTEAATTPDLAGRLEEFLRSVEPALADAKVTDVQPLTGGSTNIMRRFSVATVAGTREYVARTDSPPGTAWLTSDREHEWRVVRALAENSAVRMPTPRWYDADGSALGGRTIIFDHHPGRTLLDELRSDGEEDRAALSDRLCDAAAAVHAAELSDALTSRPVDWSTYIDALVDRARGIAEMDDQCDPFFQYLAAWLNHHRPAPVPLTLVHGDFQAPNIMLGEDGEFSLIDWEFAHIGDPREDFGRFKMAALLTPPDLIAFDEERFCDHYRDITGLSEEQINPSVLSYFAALGLVDVLAMMVSNTARYARGELEGVSIAYGALLQSALHQVVYALIAGADAARPPERTRT